MSTKTDQKYVTAGATDEQVDYILDRVAEQGTKVPTVEQIATWNLVKAAELIEWFAARKANRKLNPVVPDGYYALRTANIGGEHVNEVNFYRVNMPTSGKWAGFVFVDHIVSEERYPVKGKAKFDVLREIARDLEGAFALYGQEEQKCGICHRNLTNDDSRKRGIGPVCAGKAGF